MTNTKVDQTAIKARLSRFGGITSGQRTALAQVLNPVVMGEVSDALLATVIGATLPTLPINPDGGLPLGLPGAMENTRYVGATTSGPPVEGEFEVGDYVVSRGDGSFYICTAAGEPGDWVQASGGSDGTSSGLPLGLPGATVGTRWVGATSTGAPTTGSFRVGDFVITLDASFWVCTGAGSPGTWVQVAGGGGGSGAIDPSDPLIGVPGGLATLDDGGIVEQPPAVHGHSGFISGVQAEGVPQGFQPVLNVVGIPVNPDPANGRLTIGGTPVTISTLRALGDFTRTNTTSLGTWTDLNSPTMASGQFWIFRGLIEIASDSTALAKILAVAPAGADFACRIAGMQTTVSSETGGYKQVSYTTPTGNTATQFGGFGASLSKVLFPVEGWCAPSGTSGQVQFQLAQQVAGATVTAGKKWSNVTYTRLL